jgi:hypothetical protein
VGYSAITDSTSRIEAVATGPVFPIRSPPYTRSIAELHATLVEIPGKAMRAERPRNSGREQEVVDC